MLSGRNKEMKKQNKINLSDGFLLSRICQYLTPIQLSQLSILSKDWHQFITKQYLNDEHKIVTRLSKQCSYYHSPQGFFVRFNSGRYLKDIERNIEHHVELINNCINLSNTLIKYSFIYFWSANGSNYELLNYRSKEGLEPNKRVIIGKADLKIKMDITHKVTSVKEITKTIHRPETLSWDSETTRNKKYKPFEMKRCSHLQTRLLLFGMIKRDLSVFSIEKSNLHGQKIKHKL